jgi:hypothetical protein
VRDLLEGAEKDKVEYLASEFNRIMSHESLLKNDEETLAICRDWQTLSNELFNVYQEKALAELDYDVKPLKFSKLLRQFKKRKTKK